MCSLARNIEYNCLMFVFVFVLKLKGIFRSKNWREHKPILSLSLSLPLCLMHIAFRCVVLFICLHDRLILMFEHSLVRLAARLNWHVRIACNFLDREKAYGKTESNQFTSIWMCTFTQCTHQQWAHADTHTHTHTQLGLSTIFFDKLCEMRAYYIFAADNNVRNNVCPPKWERNNNKWFNKAKNSRNCQFQTELLSFLRMTHDHKMKTLYCSNLKPHFVAFYLYLFPAKWCIIFGSLK